MKHYSDILRLLWVGSLTAALFSCSGEEINEGNAEKGMPLEVNIIEETSRGPVEGNYMPKGNLNIFTLNKYTDEYNVKGYYHGDGYLELEKTVYVTEPVTVCACYPYNEETVYFSFDIEAETQTDYMYGYSVDSEKNKTTVDKDNPVADILMKHAMSRITFNVKSKSGTHHLDKIELNSIPVKASIDLIDEDYSINSYSNMDVNVDADISANGYEVDIMVIPCAIKCYVDFYFGSKRYSGSFIGGNWEAGKQYYYDVTILDNRLIIGQSSISNWTVGSTNSVTVK